MTKSLNFMLILLLKCSHKYFDYFIIKIWWLLYYWNIITTKAIRIFVNINPFHTNVPFLYPLKTLENLWFSDVFRGYRNGTLAWKVLTHFSPVLCFEWKSVTGFYMKRKTGLKWINVNINKNWTWWWIINPF